MDRDIESVYEGHRFPPYPQRVRGPRFALLVLIIFAILSLLLALIVAYVLV